MKIFNEESSRIGIRIFFFKKFKNLPSKSKLSFSCGYYISKNLEWKNWNGNTRSETTIS